MRVASSLGGVEAQRDGAGTLTASLAPPATASSLNAALVSAGVQVSALIPVHESLEDVFVELVEGADAVR